jgi:hypothetical protein
MNRHPLHTHSPRPSPRSSLRFNGLGRGCPTERVRGIPGSRALCTAERPWTLPMNRFSSGSAGIPAGRCHPRGDSPAGKDAGAPGGFMGILHDWKTVEASYDPALCLDLNLDLILPVKLRIEICPPGFMGIMHGRRPWSLPMNRHPRHPHSALNRIAVLERPGGQCHARGG